MNTGFVRLAVATVPTVYGIETLLYCCMLGPEKIILVATVPTVYGIETHNKQFFYEAVRPLQQYLPFTVLKPNCSAKETLLTL